MHRAPGTVDAGSPLYDQKPQDQATSGQAMGGQATGDNKFLGEVKSGRSRMAMASILARLALPTQTAVLAPLVVLCVALFIGFGLVTSIALQTALLRDSIDRDLTASVALEDLDTQLTQARIAFDPPLQAQGIPAAKAPTRQQRVAAMNHLDQLRRDLMSPRVGLLGGQVQVQKRDPDVSQIIAGLTSAGVRIHRALGPPGQTTPDHTASDEIRADLQSLSQRVGVHRAALTRRAQLQAQQAVSVGGRAQNFALAGLTLILCLALAAAMFSLSQARQSTRAATRKGFRLGRIPRHKTRRQGPAPAGDAVCTESPA